MNYFLNRIIFFFVIILAFFCTLPSYANDDAEENSNTLNFVNELTNSSQKNEEDVKTFLPVSKAFVPNIEYGDNNVVQITITPAKTYYLYKSKIELQYVNGDKEELHLSNGLKHTDDFMGTQEIYYRPVKITVTLKDNAILTYQGCTQGMCYPPQKIKLPIQSPIIKNNNDNKDINVNIETKENTINNTLTSFDEGYSNQNSKLDNDTLNKIKSALLFFIIGISLSFTPCVFPMYPVLSIILFGKNASQHNTKTFMLSLFFVLGISLAYTVLGVLTGLMGTKIHSFLQQPFMLIIFSVLFLLLSLSMLGLFNFQIPSFITKHLQKISDTQKSGTYFGSFIVGIISAIVCSPCTTAPVSASLLYTIKQGDIVWGTIDLFLMGFGMGVPMLAIGALGKKILPKAGSWMVLVKQLIGIFSLCIPLILLDRILPHYVMVYGTVILVTIGVYIIINHFIKNIRIISAILMISLVSLFIFLNKNALFDETSAQKEFINISSLIEINKIISEAKNDKQKILIDFYATWCTACKQYEMETFANNNVKNKLKEYKLIRVDLSVSSEENEKISGYYKLVGLPSIAIIDTLGKTTVLSGFYNADQLLQQLQNIQ